MTDVLARRDRALTPEETEQLLRDRLGGGVERTVQEFGVFTVWITQDSWVQAAHLCRDESSLAYDMFDSLFGVDAREDGFDVVAILYSTSTGNRIALRTRCEGGREEPVCPSMSDVYRGADWMERETWDMFGIDFPGHPGISPRLLTVENFEGWPLRKDFHLASRAAKHWPGVAEPKELDDDGNIIERERRIGDAPGPYELDKAMAEQAQLANPAPPEPPVATEEGTEVAAASVEADLAEDSGGVLAGAQEQRLEDHQKLRQEADAEVAGEEAGIEVAGEQTGDVTDDPDTGARGGDAADDARARADERRKRQAEARARKAAERAQEADAGDSSTADGEREGDA